MTAVDFSTGKEAGCSPSDSFEFEGLFLFEWQAMKVGANNYSHIAFALFTTHVELEVALVKKESE